MESIKRNLTQANHYIKSAGHILYVTYPLVQDNKLFIGIIENIDKALKLSLDSLLYYERLYKRINPYHDSFNAKIDLFRRVISRRYDINGDTPSFIVDISEIVKNRKSAPVEFPRKEGFVICDANYKTRILKLEELKDYFSKAKVFILKVNNIISGVK
jgi:hypothetical protein